MLQKENVLNQACDFISIKGKTIKSIKLELKRNIQKLFGI